MAAIIETNAPEDEPWVISRDVLRNRSKRLNPEIKLFYSDCY